MCPTPPTGTFRWQPRIVFWKFHAVSS
jgi:hypothetical protein